MEICMEKKTISNAGLSHLHRRNDRSVNVKSISFELHCPKIERNIRQNSALPS